MSTFDPDDGETVAYSGRCLDELIRAGEMSQSSVSVAPVAYSLAQPPVVARPPRVGFALSLGMGGVVLGLLVAISLLGGPITAAAGAPARLEKHEHAGEKTPLAATPRAKAAPAIIVTAPGARRSTRPVARPSRPVVPAPVVDADQAAADEQLIRAAQLERPF